MDLMIIYSNNNSTYTILYIYLGILCIELTSFKDDITCWFPPNQKQKAMETCTLNQKCENILMR